MNQPQASGKPRTVQPGGRRAAVQDGHPAQLLIVEVTVVGEHLDRPADDPAAGGTSPLDRVRVDAVRAELTAVHDRSLTREQGEQRGRQGAHACTIGSGGRAVQQRKQACGRRTFHRACGLRVAARHAPRLSVPRGARAPPRTDSRQGEPPLAWVAVCREVWSASLVVDPGEKT